MGAAPGADGSLFVFENAFLAVVAVKDNSARSRRAGGGLLCKEVDILDFAWHLRWRRCEGLGLGWGVLGARKTAGEARSEAEGRLEGLP